MSTTRVPGKINIQRDGPLTPTPTRRVGGGGREQRAREQSADRTRVRQPLLPSPGRPTISRNRESHVRARLIPRLGTASGSPTSDPTDAPGPIARQRVLAKAEAELLRVHRGLGGALPDHATGAGPGQPHPRAERTDPAHCQASASTMADPPHLAARPDRRHRRRPNTTAVSADRPRSNRFLWRRPAPAFGGFRQPSRMYGIRNQSSRRQPSWAGSAIPPSRRRRAPGRTVVF
jgi:hypothetical protein